MHGPGSVSSSPFQHSETYYRAISARNQGPISATEFSGFYVLRLSEPPYDYLLRPIDLLVDLPTRANESIDVFLIFADVGVLAEHRFALARPSGSQFARRERAADLRPERWPPLRIETRRPTLEALIDRIALLGEARSVGRGRLLGRDPGRNVPTAEAANDRGILDLLGAVGAGAHDR